MAIDSTTDLEFGYSAAGMKSLDEKLNQLMYEDVCTALDTLQKDVETSLAACWQGNSHDAFVKDFAVEIQRVKDEIQKEYADLRNRFNELAEYFFVQDNTLYTSKEGE